MNKFNFAAISQNLADSERYSPYEHKDKFVTWGRYNDLPNQLIRLYLESPTHATCVNAIVEAIIGEGITVESGVTLEIANQDGETWNQILSKVAKDYYIFGGFALEVIWSKDRTKIAEVYHIDFSYLRAKEKDYKGKIPGYYISDEWGVRSEFVGIDLDKLPYLPGFNSNTSGKEPNQIYVHQPYQPGMKYYPMPLYSGGLKVIELDAEIDTFHLANIKNGMAPSIAITTFTNAEPDERAAIERQLRLQYEGSSKAGRFFYMDVDMPENAPKIETIQTNNADGYYNVLNEATMQKILTAHRITSPEMFGIMTPGKLGAKDDVENAYLLFLNTVVVPIQASIVDCFSKLLDINVPNIKIGIIQTNLFRNQNTTEDVVTGLDSENNEEAELEAQIQKTDDMLNPQSPNTL